ncbi:MAG TPA: ABC transporter permease [Longimicrobium sp.]|nr:ABC transporter permease [Longimicrobium sp.]
MSRIAPVAEQKTAPEAVAVPHVSTVRPAAPSALRRAAESITPLVIIAAVIGAWWVAAADSPIFPTPPEVVTGLRELLTSGLLWKHIWTSLMRVGIAYFTATAIAIPLGILMGWFTPLDRALNPLFQLMRPISPIAWTPIAILWFGIGGISPIFLIFLGAFFPQVVATASAVRGVGQHYIRAARNFELSGPRFFARVLFPAALPEIITGMRIALGVAWLVVVAAEMVATESGLGYMIIDARNQVTRYDLVVGAMVLIGIIGLILDGIMRQVERIDLLRWRHGG